MNALSLTSIDKGFYFVYKNSEIESEITDCLELIHMNSVGLVHRRFSFQFIPNYVGFFVFNIYW